MQPSRHRLFSSSIRFFLFDRVFRACYSESAVQMGSIARISKTCNCSVFCMSAVTRIPWSGFCQQSGKIRIFRFPDFKIPQFLSLNSSHNCRCFAFQIGKICCQNCIIRDFQFRKSLPVNSNLNSHMKRQQLVDIWAGLYYDYNIEENICSQRQKALWMQWFYSWRIITWIKTIN